jgi:APA family basic amino acid/polyamine antiporter
LASATMATLGVLGSHLAGDFFLGVDILVTSMLVNFLMMTVAVLALPVRNPALAAAVTVLPSRAVQAPLALAGAIVLAVFLGVHTWRDLTTAAAAWYFRSTPVWAVVMTVGTLIYLRERAALVRRGVDLAAHFRDLPPE